jgi:hypothetical protein
MEEVVARANLQAALRQVRNNRGSAGVDGMTVDELPAYLRRHWPQIREQLLTGQYQPQPIKRVEILGSLRDALPELTMGMPWASRIVTSALPVSVQSEELVFMSVTPPAMLPVAPCIDAVP